MEKQKDKPPAPPEQATDADSDPDFDDLDDVLDQFSANAPSAQSKAPISSSDPGRPESSEIPIPQGPKPDESEDDFIKRLTAEMSSVMSQMSTQTNENASPEDLAKMGKELEEFTHKMEAEGVKPEDLLKAILGEEAGTKLGDVAHEERDRRESQSQSQPKPQLQPQVKSAEPEGEIKDKTPASFEDTIRRTIDRLESSSAAATSASQQKTEEDMLADLLKSLETSGDGNDGDLSKMFLGMMEQLTNRDMLYEPMAELNTKFPQWLSENKGKLKPEDSARYLKQKDIVKDIVAKFEEDGYSDDDPKCREFIWEKMQKMQEQGAPPSDLIQSPMGLPGLGGGGGGEEGMEDGCPTQ